MVQLAGTLILGVVLAQGVVLLIASLRRAVQQKEQDRLALDLIRAQVDVARTQRAKAESEQEVVSWKGYRKFEIKRRRKETDDICSFYLAPHDGKPLPPFRPGQFLTFQLQIPDPESKRRDLKATVRCYSLSDAPNSSYYRISIKRLAALGDGPPGVASNFFHGRVGVNDILDIKAPSGNFFLDLDQATPIVLIAGGVGITPMMSMLNTLITRGVEREVWFFYGINNRREAMRMDYLERMGREHHWLRFHACLSRPDPGDIGDPEMHHEAFVSVDLFKQLLPSNNYEYYICGPPPMMEALTTGLRAWGVPDDLVHFEAFGPASVKKATTTTAAATTDKAAVTYKVKFAKSNNEVVWDDGMDSLLELAEENDVTMDSGCRAGNCGSCLTAIRSGEVRYMVEPSAVPEPGSCLACIAIPASDLELDA